MSEHYQPGQESREQRSASAPETTGNSSKAQNTASMSVNMMQGTVPYRQESGPAYYQPYPGGSGYPGPYYMPAQEKQKKKGRLLPFLGGLFLGLLLMGIVTGAMIARFPGLATTLMDGGLTASEASELIEKVDQLMRNIHLRYIEEVDNEVMLDGAYHGLVTAIGDRYAAYFNQEELQAQMESSSGSYVGIGVTVSPSSTSGGAEVVGVNPLGDAFAQGIREGDIIVAADGEDLTGLDLNIMVTKIRGEEGTYVTVTVVRGSEELDFRIERRKIDSVTVMAHMIGEDTGYVVITEFDGVTGAQFSAALETLKEAGMKKLVLDLRNNPGGLLTSVLDVADELLPKGVVSYMEDKYGNRSTYSNEDSLYLNMPMVVLINGNSASASELLAGAVQDTGVGTLVGEQSFGKGIVQSTMPFSDGTALKVTIEYYYTPNGRNIHGSGITPDEIVSLPEGESISTLRGADGTPDLEKDLQLLKALEILKDAP